MPHTKHHHNGHEHAASEADAATSPSAADDMARKRREEAMTQPSKENLSLEHPSYEELEKLLTEAVAKATENWDKVLRTQAEMNNMRSRFERDIASAHKFSVEKLVRELLPVIDNLERSLTVEGVSDVALREGVQLTLKMFQDGLAKFNVQAVDPINQAFNPALHEAMSTMVQPGVAAGTVLQVLQKGYLLHDRLIRPAFVIVAKEP